MKNGKDMLVNQIRFEIKSNTQLFTSRAQKNRAVARSPVVVPPSPRKQDEVDTLQELHGCRI